MDEEWDKYCEWTYEEFFSGIPIGSNVIEIGPAFGFHTKLIQRQKPNHHRCIEPNVLMKEALEDEEEKCRRLEQARTLSSNKIADLEKVIRSQKIQSLTEVTISS